MVNTWGVQCVPPFYGIRHIGIAQEFFAVFQGLRLALLGWLGPYKASDFGTGTCLMPANFELSTGET